MNKARRKELSRAVELLEEAQSIIESCRDEEQEYMDNMPENLQESEKYCAAEDAVDNMNEAYDEIGEAIDSVESAME